MRVAADGPCPLTLVEDSSSDREWAPLHSHPWDELPYVLEGEEVARHMPPEPTLERLVEIAGRRGVRPAFGLPGS